MSKPAKSKFELAVIQKVTELRQLRGMSQEYVAHVLNLTKGFIGQVESPNHPSKYNLNHLNRLAHEMNCSPADFMPDSAITEDFWE
jgi:transcriptional regulator with XRE-family HTH domain